MKLETKVEEKYIYPMSIYIIDISIKNKKYSLEMFGKSNIIPYICSAHGALKPHLLADE